MKSEKSPSSLLHEALEKHQSGNIGRASELYSHVLELEPQNVDALHLLGVASSQLGDNIRAEQLIRRAVVLRPDIAVMHNNLGNALKESGKIEEAADSYARALTLEPSYAEAHNNLGNIFYESGLVAEAIKYYRNAINLSPGYAEAHYNMGNALARAGHFEDSIQFYNRSLQLSPDSAETYNSLGNVFYEAGRIEEARTAYERALALNPEFSDAYNNLGTSHSILGNQEAASDCYQKALNLSPSDGIKIKLATTLPSVVGSLAELEQARKRFAQSISELSTQKLHLKEPDKEVGRIHFYLSYHGLNDLELQKQIAQVYINACPDLLYTSDHCKNSHLKEKTTIHIGFISRFFKDEHIIWRVMKGIVENLSRERFKVSLYSPDKIQEGVLRSLQNGERAIHLPNSIAEARDIISHDCLDILFYTDIGMDPFTYFLAFSRLAPVQCTHWGHPVTTGIPNVDYYLSAQGDESESAFEHYSEKLVLLEKRPLCYPRPELTRVMTRDDFGLSTNDHIYLCPTTPFKVHPSFDAILRDILINDPNGRLVLVEHKQKHSIDLLRKRLHSSMPEVIEKVIFVPRQNSETFLSLLNVTDVVLDTPFFNGGTTSLEAFSLGVPVVTMPTEFLRGRFTYAYYKQMGVMDCVASSSAEYVDISTRLGTDQGYRELVSKKINAASSCLYEDKEAVEVLEKQLIELLNSKVN
jgi:protein O-GlcNAc transferase